ncbi:MAG: NUDIX hydrolase [Chitinophagaceae bacterium]|nr:NUDIX hydrolase [Chitinophagaceae bacterium]
MLNTYSDVFPEDTQNCEPFRQYLLRNNERQIYDRKNFDGHITTSAFIIDTRTNEILLLHHKSLNRWLQPGGHTEGDGTLVASALREAVEETGISESELTLLPVADNSDVPFDIDSHYIPPNPKKNEDGHTHHDLRYLFEYTGNNVHQYNTEEALGLRWIKLEDLLSDDTFGAVVRKVKTFLGLNQGTAT